VTAGNAQDAADNAMLWCSSQSAYSSGQCRSLQEAISKSLNGALGLRAGAVCTRLGQCKDCDGAVTLGSVSSPLDICTLEGVTPGTQLAGTYAGTGEACSWFVCGKLISTRANLYAMVWRPWLPLRSMCYNSSMCLFYRQHRHATTASLLNMLVVVAAAAAAHAAGVGPEGTCQSESDCGSGSTCRSNQATVCRCLNGADSCSKVGRCVPLPPPPPPPPPPPTPCELCQQCITDFAGTVASTASMTDTAAIARTVFQKCKALDGYTDLQCSQLRTEVATSFQGNSGKRAAVICARLQQCNTGTLPASCSLTSGSLNAALSMCSVEGVTGGAAVSGIAADNGEWHGTSCPVGARPDGC
jgi:hypothetical protein